MAKYAVEQRCIPIRVACAAFVVSESCYRYASKQNAENQEIANWLMRLTDNHRNWGFGLCYLYLRPAQREELRLEPQARVPHLPRVGAQPAHQTP